MTLLYRLLDHEQLLAELLLQSPPLRLVDVAPSISWLSSVRGVGRQPDAASLAACSASSLLVRASTGCSSSSSTQRTPSVVVWRPRDKSIAFLRWPYMLDAAKEVTIRLCPLPEALRG
jgi:hypothetical protein